MQYLLSHRLQPYYYTVGVRVPPAMSGLCVNPTPDSRRKSSTGGEMEQAVKRHGNSARKPLNGFDWLNRIHVSNIGLPGSDDAGRWRHLWQDINSDPTF